MGNPRRTRKNRRIAMKKTNLVYESEHIGLEAVTIHNQTPYFFLFYELDIKNHESVRIIVDYFKSRRLAFLFYETQKGFHFISPCLMRLREWDKARKELKELNLNYYHNLAIRIDTKKGDRKICFWENSTYPEEFKISSTLLDIYSLRFNDKFPCNDLVETKLFYVKYKQTRIDNDIFFS